MWNLLPRTTCPILVHQEFIINRSYGAVLQIGNIKSVIFYLSTPVRVIINFYFRTNFGIFYFIISTLQTFGTKMYAFRIPMLEVKVKVAFTYKPHFNSN